MSELSSGPGSGGSTTVSFCEACRRQHSNFPRNVGNEALDVIALSPARHQQSGPILSAQLFPGPAHLQLTQLRLGLSLSSETPSSFSTETAKPLTLLQRMQGIRLFQRGSRLRLGYLCGTMEVSAA